MGFNNPIVGGTALRIPAIQSPNYSPGVAGWIVKINGDAEFNNLTVRGEFVGTRFIINSAGIFLYASTPAAGNLIGSWASTSGTDTFGNAYQSGLSLYDVVNGSVINLDVGGGAAVQQFTPPAASGVTWQPGTVVASISNVFGANTAEMSITGAYNQAHVSQPSINMFGSSDTQTSNRIDLVTQTARITGTMTSGNTDWGQGSAVMSAVASVDVTVTFSKTFPNVPHVVATLSNSPTLPAGSTALTVRVFGVSTTGCTLRVSDVGAVARTLTIGVDWFAVSS